jgi:beta-glucosidase
MRSFTAGSILGAVASLLVGTAVADTGSANYTDYLLSSGTVKLGVWQDAYDKANATVSALTLTEKLYLINGIAAGGLTALRGSDSSSNPLYYIFVTAWPSGISMTMTWDRDLIRQQGEALGAEFVGKGLNYANAPTLEAMGRSPWGGRIAESYSPDSYLAGYVFPRSPDLLGPRPVALTCLADLKCWVTTELWVGSSSRYVLHPVFRRASI